MTVQSPIPDYSAARQAMVDGQLRPQGVNDPAVIEAMSLVPREQFVPEDVRPLAYSDRAVPLGGGRMLGPPEALGLLLTAIGPRRGERGLVVGAGTGYAAAVVAQMGIDVIALESSGELAAVGRRAGITVVEGALEAGHDKGAPYDFVLIDGAVAFVPDAIVEQLADGGRIGFARVDRGITRLMFGRKAAGSLGFHSLADVGVPALPGFTRPRAFTF